MGKLIDFFKPQPKAQLDPSVEGALRDVAGWPTQRHAVAGNRHRHRHITVHRDALGRVIGSVESIDEDEYEESSDSWAK